MSYHFLSEKSYMYQDILEKGSAPCNEPKGITIAEIAGKVKKFYGHQTTIEQRVFWGMLPVIALVALVSLIGSAAESMGLTAVIFASLCFLGAIVIGIFCYRSNACSKWYTIMCVLFNGVFIPAAFISNGGINSGMPLFCLCGITICGFSPRRQNRYILAGFSVVVYIMMFILEMNFPGIVHPVRPDFINADVLISLLVSGASVVLLVDRALGEYNAQSYREINNGLVESLGSLMEFRSQESGRHVENIKQFTGILLQSVNRNMENVNFSPAEIELICSAAVLHDIGKATVPDSILNKPGRLTKDEYETIKGHTISGAHMIDTMKGFMSDDFYRCSYEICLHHHERYDGSGYPDGLRGEDIPLIAQIVGLADVYDALTNRRIYKKAYAVEKAYDIIANRDRALFSDRVLRCFESARPELENVVLSRLEALEEHDGLKPKAGMGMALCLSDSYGADRLEDLLLSYIGTNGIAARVEKARELKDLLEMMDAASYDYVFVDSDSAEVEAAFGGGRVPGCNKDTGVFFVCTDEEDENSGALRTVSGGRYLITSITEDAVRDALNRAFHLYRKLENTTVEFKTKKGVYSLQTTDIIMCRTDDHFQEIILSTGE